MDIREIEGIVKKISTEYKNTDEVKIGVSAPKEVPVYRKEVYVQIQEANKEAMSAENMLNISL